MIIKWPLTSGKWIKGPGKKLINAIKEELDGDLAMVDDYTSAGLLPGVKKLLNINRMDRYKGFDVCI